jgi:hypothetical protein
MTTITLSVPDNKITIILSFLKELPFAKIESVSKEKERILKDLKTALKEVQQIEKGEMTAIPIEELLTELRNVNRSDFERILAKVPDVEPEEFDRL